jgi:hypothetical protein
MSQVWTPLHWTTPRIPTVPPHAIMFEQVSWQSAPHVGSQALAALQSIVHDAPHIPVHASPFWHCTMHPLPLQAVVLDVDVEVDAVDVVEEVGVCVEDVLAGFVVAEVDAEMDDTAIVVDVDDDAADVDEARPASS